MAKLEEHFRAAHVYNSAGIEGNRLTLQETMLVLKEGIDISGKPLGDSIEVKNLGHAFDYLKTLADANESIRESDIRSLHSLVMGNAPETSAGEYRKTGVIISGSEHRPPEPLAVPGRMESLVKWIHTNLKNDPIIVSTIAHHELTAVHPFKDGNGRVSRLLMNLILLKSGYPICNITKTNRPAYYDALSFADVGLHEPLIRLVRANCGELFSEYVRIRTETKRTTEWAAKWGMREAEVLRKRETREMELWQSRIRQVFLEFQRAAELLDDKLGQIEIEFFDYQNEITFEKYQQLIDNGRIERGNAFSISFTDKRNQHRERFMFRYYRNLTKFPAGSTIGSIIPLELNHFSEDKYARVSDIVGHERIRVRDLYFGPEGEFHIRYFNADKYQESERKGGTIAEAATWFFDDVLKHFFHLG